MDDSIATSFPLSAERFGKGRIAAIADADQRRRIVVVLGMHRSGTSLCAHILSAMGIDMADELRENSSNPRGHWERWEIVEFHDRILELFNRSYFGPCHDFSLPVAWWADLRVHQIKGKIVAFLKQRMGESDFGFKDPRTVRLMPLWHQIFNDLKLTPKIILCLRNPAQVTRSLKARDSIEVDNGEYRWLVHMADFYRYSGNFDTCTVEYEEWFRDPLVNFERLRTFLDLRWQQSEADLGLVLSGIIDPALRHDSSDYKEASHPLVRSLYELATDAGGARGPSGHIDIVSQFVSFQRLQEPFQRAFERAADLAAKFPELEQEVAALRSAVEDRDAQIEAAGSRASVAEARVVEVLSDTEGLRTRLDEIGRERDAQIEAAGSRASVAEARVVEVLFETEGLRTRLDEIGRERDENEAALEVAQSRLAEREAALKDALGRADEFAALLKSAEIERMVSLAEFEAQKASVAALASEHDALATTSAKLQSEIETLRTVLAETSQSRERGDAVTADLKAKIASLQTAYGRAEERRQEREAASIALQAEITALKNQLSIAREVGSAALASLKIETVVPPETPRAVGRLASLRQFFGFRAKDWLAMAK